MQPASLQSLSVCGLTVSVILFAAEGLLSGMPMFMLVTVWISTLVAGTGIYFLFTVVFVVFDNWCCYPPGSSFDDFTLGRCTVRTSQIIHTVGKWHKCNSHDFTRGEIIGIGVICGAFVIWLVLFVIRIILFKASLYRLCVLRRLAGRLRNKHAVTAYNAAVRESRRLRSLPDFRTRSHPALLYRFRYILAGDPASILFGYCAVAANMKAWHVLLQVQKSNADLHVANMLLSSAGDDEHGDVGMRYQLSCGTQDRVDVVDPGDFWRSFGRRSSCAPHVHGRSDVCLCPHGAE